MNPQPLSDTRARGLGFAQWVLILTGFAFLLAGIALIFVPNWFYDHIGHFPPFNRHYAGDAGTFSLPIGIGALIAARAPEKNLGLIVMVAIASVFHWLNHCYDWILDGTTANRFLTDVLPLGLQASSVIVVLISLQRKSRA
jgi:hypothetical protein